MTTTHKKDPKTIENMFNSIAARYDKANAAMSFNLHTRWNLALANIILSNGVPSQYLDLCSGTGEIAKKVLNLIDAPCEAFLLDFSENMLTFSKPKLRPLENKGHKLHFLHADALQIPLPSESMDAISIAYGIRNVKDPAACAEEARRVLKKGGIFAILELTQPKNPLMRLGHNLYLKTMLPIIGKTICSNKQAYQYLSESVQSFIPPQDLENILKEKGFQETRRISLNCGIATIITGKKG